MRAWCWMGICADEMILVFKPGPWKRRDGDSKLRVFCLIRMRRMSRAAVRANAELKG